MIVSFRAIMLRAADMVDTINERDVLDAQELGLRNGMTLEQVAKIDRALLASIHIRECAKRCME